MGNPADKDLGQIDDLVVDMTSGKVRYAILEFEPCIFEGEQVDRPPRPGSTSLGSRSRLTIRTPTCRRRETPGVE